MAREGGDARRQRRAETADQRHHEQQDAADSGAGAGQHPAPHDARQPRDDAAEDVSAISRKLLDTLRRPFVIGGQFGLQGPIPAPSVRVESGSRNRFSLIRSSASMLSRSSRM